MWYALSAGLALLIGGTLVWCWWPRASQAAVVGAQEQAKIAAANTERLEQSLEQEWKENHAQDEVEAARATDRDSALDFLRASFAPRGGSARPSAKP